jgi:hypothetical protein
MCALKGNLHANSAKYKSDCTPFSCNHSNRAVYLGTVLLIAVSFWFIQLGLDFNL